MKCSLCSVLVVAATMALLSSCDSSSNSAKDDTPSPQDTSDTPVTPAGTVVAPVFSPSGGTYSSAQSVMLSSGTSGAAIYYTTDGSIPTTSSTRYTSPVTVSATWTLKAIAVKSGMTTSPVTSAAYMISSGSSGSTIPWNTSITYGSLSYGGQTYKTVVIGAQTWMAENLNYKMDSSWWYANSADSGAKYGRLYTWAAAMKLADSCNYVACADQVKSIHQGICPEGWHIPSDTEWNTLLTYLGSDSVGAKLTSNSGWDDDENGTDAYGFRAIPAGHRRFAGVVNVGNIAFFWSSSEFNSTYASYFNAYSFDASLEHGYGKHDGHSVRCLMGSL